MSMSDCEKELARLIHVIVEYGNYVEDARIELANSTNFSPFASFRRINASSTGFLTEDDLDNFLRQNGLVLNEGALTQFFTMEKDKSYKITYNNFLNQMLPTTNIDLRNSCLERPHHRNNEVSSADVDQLITAVYQKENEYTRVVEGVKNRLLMFSNSLLDRIFQSLADDVTGYLSFKSISTFMKQNNYSFNKKDYESFMSRVDKNLTGKVSPTDFKYLMFPHGTISNTNRQNELTHHKAGSIFSGISPIKNWNSSPNKNTARKPFEASMIGENDRSLLALKAKSNAHSPDNKFPTTSELGQKVNPSSLKGEQKFSVSNKPHDGAPNSRAILYNQEIAAINDQIILQNAPETNYKDKNSKNPLEWRYLDPVYHNYWSYHRDHNRTLSPNYFNRAESRTFPHNQRSHNPSRPGTNFVPFFNPTFVDPGTYENLERYPENPFRYTDHGHFFKNYYASLRHNYYDQYYNYIPYKTKVPSSKSERNSPEKSRHLSRSHSPQSNLNHIDYNYNEQQVRSNDNLVADGLIPFSKKQPAQNYPSQGQPEKPPRRTHDILSEHEILRQPRPQQVDTVPYQYVFVSDHNSQAQEENELKSAIKIEKQPFLASPKLNQDPLKNFAKDKREPHITEDLNSNKPYTFVVVNSKNNI